MFYALCWVYNLVTRTGGSVRERKEDWSFGENMVWECSALLTSIEKRFPILGLHLKV